MTDLCYILTRSPAIAEKELLYHMALSGMLMKAIPDVEILVSQANVTEMYIHPLGLHSYTQTTGQMGYIAH